MSDSLKNRSAAIIKRPTGNRVIIQLFRSQKPPRNVGAFIAER